MGFSSSFAVVLTGLRAVGANDGQARSGLVALCLVTGALTVLLSVRTRVPSGVAWSTPGAAVLAGTAGAGHSFGEAVAGFLGCALLLGVTAAVPVAARAVASVPVPVSAGLLAGVLLPLCLAPATAARERPALVLPVVLAWVVALRLARRLAVVAAVVAAALAVALAGAGPHPPVTGLLPRLTLTAPTVSSWALVGVALPLYLTTMAGQNLPAVALLRGFGYQPRLRPLLGTTAAGTALVASLGGHTVNLAALTTALTAGPDADPDPARRWRGTAVSGAAYIALGLTSGAVVAAASLAPASLVRTIAGLALVGALGDALHRALAAAPERLDREAALATLLVTVSGVTVDGLGSPVLGLAAGLTLHAVGRRR